MFYTVKYEKSLKLSSYWIIDSFYCEEFYQISSLSSKNRLFKGEKEGDNLSERKSRSKWKEGGRGRGTSAWSTLKMIIMIILI